MPVPQQFSLLQPLFHLGCFSSCLKGLRLLERKRVENRKGREKNCCNTAEGEAVLGWESVWDLGSGETCEDLWLQLSLPIFGCETQCLCCHVCHCSSGFDPFSPLTHSWNQLCPQPCYLWSASWHLLSLWDLISDPPWMGPVFHRWLPFFLWWEGAELLFLSRLRSAGLVLSSVWHPLLDVCSSKMTFDSAYQQLLKWKCKPSSFNRWSGLHCPEVLVPDWTCPGFLLLFERAEKVQVFSCCAPLNQGSGTVRDSRGAMDSLSELHRPHCWLRAQLCVGLLTWLLLNGKNLTLVLFALLTRWCLLHTFGFGLVTELG